MQVIEDLSDFRDLKTLWDSLVAASEARGPFATSDWLQNWLTHFATNRELRIVYGWEPGRLLWAVPLTIGEERITGLKMRTVRTPTNSYSGPFDALVRPGYEEQAYRSVIRWLLDEHWDVLVLPYLPEGANLGRWIRRDFPWYARRGLVSPYIVLRPSFEELLRTRSRHFRQNLRRKIRKALDLPGFEVRRARDLSGALDFWRCVEAIEPRSWKNREGTAITSDPVVHRYYENLVRLAAQNGWAYFVWAVVDGVPAAYDLAIAFGETVYSLKIGYDPAFSSLSAGAVTKAITIQYCCEDGFREHDLMGHVEDWKLRYTNLMRRHVNLYAFNPRSRKAMALWRMCFRPRGWLRDAPVIGQLGRSRIAQTLLRRLGLT